MKNGFHDQKGIRYVILSAIRFSTVNLMKLTFFKGLKQKVSNENSWVPLLSRRLSLDVLEQ